MKRRSLVSNRVQYPDKLHREEDPGTLHQADDEGDGPDEEQVVAEEVCKFDGTAGVVDVAGVVPHSAHGGDRLTARVGNLEYHPSVRAGQIHVFIHMKIYY